MDGSQLYGERANPAGGRYYSLVEDAERELFQSQG